VTNDIRRATTHHVDVEGFAFVHTVPVRFRDIDCRGHVNNAVFSSYIEDARLKWFTAAGDPDEPPPQTFTVDMVLARTEIDFRGEVRDPDETIEIGVRVARVGTKSADLEYRLCTSGGRVVAEAKSVLVGFDYEQGTSAPIPERWLRRLKNHELIRSGPHDGGH
jgi:acyl-CoA thioester hydrolase